MPERNSNGATGFVRKVGVWCGAVISVAVIVGWAWSFLIAQALRPIVEQLDRGVARDSLIVARLRAMEVARERDVDGLAEAMRYPTGGIAQEKAIKKVKDN